MMLMFENWQRFCEQTISEIQQKKNESSDVTKEKKRQEKDNAKKDEIQTETL